jgi:hypothetical protein
MSSIFVQISAYHDYELPKTIQDCMDKISDNNNVNFGIHLCYYNKDEINLPNLKNIKIEKTMAPEGLGVGNGRFIANSFYKDEDYYLQIDAHTRFSKNWDIDFINTYKKYSNEGCNPVLTAYPSGYHYEGSDVKYDKYPSVVYADFEQNNIEENFYFLHQTSKPNKPENIFTRAVSGGEIFSSGDIATIEPNPKMFNWGEEFLTAIRLFTHGYDLMLPEKQSLYHLYYGEDEKNKRRLSGQDFPDKTNDIFNQSNIEIKNIIANRIVGRFALGDKRTIEDFEYYADIDLSTLKHHKMV